MIGMDRTVQQRAAAITAAMSGVAAQRHGRARPAEVEAGEQFKPHLMELAQRCNWFGYTAALERAAA